MNYQPDYLNYKPIFSADEKAELRTLSQKYSLQDLLDNPRQFQDSSIEYSFVSSKIEGNAYTLKDTVDLIKFGYTTGSKPFNDALMIKNINQAFDEICQRKHSFYPVLSRPFLCGLHRCRHPFFRSYGANLPSSLTRFHSYALVYSTHPPVSVCGTGRLAYAGAFLGTRSNDALSPWTQLGIQ